jgi:hypothetical protein
MYGKKNQPSKILNRLCIYRLCVLQSITGLTTTLVEEILLVTIITRPLSSPTPVEEIQFVPGLLTAYLAAILDGLAERLSSMQLSSRNMLVLSVRWAVRKSKNRMVFDDVLLVAH